MIEQPQQQPPFEYQKWVHELKRREAERAHDKVDDFAIKLNSSVIDGGNLALRTTLLINGGAAVSVLAFIGGLAAQGKINAAQQIGPIASSLVWFAIGVSNATLAMAFAYFTNFCIGEDSKSRNRIWEHPYVIETDKSRSWKWKSRLFRALAIICAFTSGVLFIYGVIEVKNAIIRLW